MSEAPDTGLRGTGGGTSQRERAIAAMGEDLFQVDGLALDQRVALSTRLAGRLRFINLQDEPEGNWRSLFEGDEALVLARIASQDTWGLRNAFMLACDSQPLPGLAQAVVDLALLVNGWLRELTGAHTAQALRLREMLQQRVNQQLALPLARLLAPPADEAAVPEHAPWHRSWGLPPAATVRARNDGLTHAELRGQGYSLLNTLGRAKALARELLPGTLDTGDHEAAPGLLLAFLRLYGTVQAEINRFSERHIDFYYDKVLGLQARPTQPDEAHVVCLRDPQAALDVVVPAGTRFGAGKDAAGQDIVFRSRNDLRVSQARVAALVTLQLQRDARIQPEASLGYVSGIRASWLGVPAADAAPVPALGGGALSHEAAPGLTLASPLLALKEGQRTVDVVLRLRWPSAVADAAALVRRLTDRKLAAAERTRLTGQLFSAWMFAGHDPLDTTLRRQLREVLLGLAGRPGAPHGWRQRNHGPSPLELMCEEPAPGFSPHDSAFHQFAAGLFDAALTTAAGWLRVPRVQVRRVPPAAGVGAGLGLTLYLPPEAAPITGCDAAVHGPQWATALPLLRLSTGRQARVHGYSLLQGVELDQAELTVEVQGVQDLRLANQLGLLDAGKPFAPFGPLPTTSSYLLVGSTEAAAKPLDRLVLHLHWGNLPTAPGGLAALYGAYGQEQAEGPFTVALSVLRDGQWHACGGASAAQPLFAGGAPDAPMPSAKTLAVDGPSLRQFHRPGNSLDEGIAQARSGVFRLQLSNPPGAFGHAAYPGLLAAALQSRARRFGHLPMPEAPYTPQLERVTLDYAAHTVLQPSAQLSDLDADPPRLLHEHPFGVTEVRASGPGRVAGVLPDLGADGNLCIGLEGAAEGGPLALLFQLHEEGAADWHESRPRPLPQWHILRNEAWEALPAQAVQSDGTQGLLSSGIVQLDLPAMPDLQERVFGRGLLWLRVSLGEGQQTCAPLVTVHAQALALQRETAAAAVGLGSAGQPLAPGVITAPLASVPGLAGVRQPEASTGLRVAEGARELRTRAGERLRHRNRGSLAWDVERLVLDAFPEVFKVKCFTPPQAGCAPGEPLVVVVPHVRRNDLAVAALAAKLDAVCLERIRAFLAARMSPFARLRVRNASYERVQVRCAVQLQRHAASGAVLREVEQRLAAWLSPWHDDGPGAQFQWQLRCDEVQGLIRQVAGIAQAGPVSLLRVVRSDDGRHSLADTARGTTGVLQHRHAWSLMLPMDHHLIERDTAPPPAPGAREPVAPRTGVARLRVGATMVVSREPAP